MKIKLIYIKTKIAYQTQTSSNLHSIPTGLPHILIENVEATEEAHVK